MQPITRDRLRWQALRSLMVEVLRDVPPAPTIGICDSFETRVGEGATVPELAAEFGVEPSDVMAQLAWIARG